MDMKQAEHLAEDLLRQSMARQTFSPLRVNGQPVDLELAYAVQDKLVGLLQKRGLGQPAGYKVGLTSSTMQSFCGVAQPIIGHLLDRRVYESGARIRALDFVRLGVECELAVLIGKPVPILCEAEDASILGDCVASVHAAFEVIEDRNADYAKLDAASIVAENSWNAGIVTALGMPPSSLGDLNQIAGRLTIGNQTVGQGISGDVMGGPLHVVKWLAGFLAGRGEALHPGQWVMTGSIIPTKFLKVGDALRFEVEGLPPVSLAVV